MYGRTQRGAADRSPKHLLQELAKQGLVQACCVKQPAVSARLADASLGGRSQVSPSSVVIQALACITPGPLRACSSPRLMFQASGPSPVRRQVCSYLQGDGRCQQCKLRAALVC